MVKENEDLTSVNVVVGECNDGYLNAIRDCVVTKEDVYEAYADCKKEFELGSVGAGRGMSCFEMSGGIGSVSYTHLDVYKRQVIISEIRVTEKINCFKAWLALSF